MKRRDFLGSLMKLLPLAATVPLIPVTMRTESNPTINLTIPDEVWKKLMTPICVWTINNGSKADVETVFRTLKERDGDTRTHFVTNIPLKVQTVGSGLEDAIKDAIYKMRNTSDGLA